MRQLVNATHAYFAAHASDQGEFEKWEEAINTDPAARKPVSRVPSELLDMMQPAGGVKVAHAR